MFTINEYLSMTQGRRIMAYLQDHKTITTMDAYNLGITSLHRRLSDLEKQGHIFNRDKVSKTYRTEDGHKITKTYKVYSLVA